MKNYLIKELRLVGNDTQVREFKKEAMNVDDVLYELQGSISKATSKGTREIRITIRETNIVNCPKCDNDWDLSLADSCECGATLKTMVYG